MTAEFRAKFIEQAKRSTAAAAHCLTEEAAKFSLVAPFLEFLGYDVRNPAEVRPEHSADFSEKYRNRVDFAILRDDIPIIAIECKGVGQTRIDDKGQLKSYFNASRPVKLGILTDGMVWELYADSDEPNMMDDSAFLSFDLKHVAEGTVTEQVLEGLFQITKDQFDPENVGTEARRKLIFKNFVDQITKLMETPSEAFCRLLLEGAGLKRIRSAGLGEYQTLAKSAFQAATDMRILSRLDIKPPVAAPPVAPATAPVANELSKVETTAGELAVFDWVTRRLAFLAEGEEEFRALQELAWRDYQSKFVVHLGGERRGRLFDLREVGGLYHFQFAPDGLEVTTADLTSIDAPLLAAFRARVRGSGTG